MRIKDNNVYSPKEGPCQQIAEWSAVPSFHVYPPYGGYLNDVNAFFKYKGRYHLFFQYAINANDTGDKVWMHASGTDLVNWEYHGTPLVCDMPFDDKGVWSGNVFFTDDGTPVIAYYAYSYGICLAFPEDASDEKLLKWKKYELNPVISAKRSDGAVVYDASNVFKTGGKYCILTGNKHQQTGRPCNYIFTSKDLLNWQSEGVFFSPDDLEDKDDMACPNLVEMPGGFWLYTFSSHYSGVKYYVGKITDGRFEALSCGKLNYYGGNEMGQSVFADEDGAVYKSWLTVRLCDNTLLKRGWSGVLTVPKRLTLDEAGKLQIQPLSQVFEQFELKNKYQFIAYGGEIMLDERARSFMLKAKVQGGGRFVVKVGVGSNEHTDVYVDFDRKRVGISFENASETEQVNNKYMFEFRDYEYRTFTESDELEGLGEDVELTVFFDKCVVEVFACGISLGKTVLPGVDSDGIAVSADGLVNCEIELYLLKKQ